VRVLRPAGLGRFGNGPTPAHAIATYRDAVRSLACDFGGPVVISPNLHGDCYGAAAALALVDPELVRIVGWQHSDNEYDARVLTHYEPVVARFVAVSDRIERVLRARLAPRAADVVNIPCGVPVGAGNSPRGSGRGGTVRMIYLGRLEHRPKRVLSLVRMSRELAALGIDHRITVAGDGPASGEFVRATESAGTFRVLGAVPPAEVPALLEEHDLFVLPSSYEGLSVAMLEAMAAGCAPVVARTESGALQVIERGWNGEIADVPPEAGDDQTGEALAAAVARALQRGLGPMREAATATVRERFSLERHVETVARLLDEVARGPARSWPASRACGFTGAGASEASGSVPPDGARRLGAILGELTGRALVIHGTGEHSRQLGGAAFASSPARIVAFTDDDPARHGSTMWNWPIVAPEAAASTGATDVVISSWMHEEAIWGRRRVYERQGLTVWRLYAGPGPPGRSEGV
jgi:glycosyltransferase involved in cell wall biosynthesis